MHTLLHTNNTAQTPLEPAGQRPRSDGLSYTLDRKNTIVAVSGDWDDFARSNDGDRMLSVNVIGQHIDRFIVGDATRMFVRTMIMSARTLQRPIYRPYRCDSPTHKRFMEMTLLPRTEGQLEIVHRQLHCEPVFHNVRLLTVAQGHGTGFLKRCSLCNRILIEGLWCEIDEAVNAGHLEVTTSPVGVIYCVCPQCLTRRGIPL